MKLLAMLHHGYSAGEVRQMRRHDRLTRLRDRTARAPSSTATSTSRRSAPNRDRWPCSHYAYAWLRFGLPSDWSGDWP